MARSVWAEWKIVDHVCRVCFGRLLVSETQTRCADCGAVGDKILDVCACGAMLMTKVNAGLRCVTNPSVSIECPSEIVVSYVGKPTDIKPLVPVKLHEGRYGLFDDA